MSRFSDGKSPAGGPLRITEEEAASSHVDDLLKRQASLQGEKGITANRGRKWYYSNWLIFGLTGGLFAGLSWLALEPNYSDTIHLRAKITDVAQPQGIEGAEKIRAIVTIKTQDTEGGGEVQSLLSDEAVSVKQDGSLTPGVNPDDLKKDVEYGIHLQETETLPIVVAVEDPPQSGANPSLMSAQRISESISLVFFAIVAALVGLGIGAIDGLMCRQLRRALLCGIAGMLIGFVGGFTSSILANIVYTLISTAAQEMRDAAGELTTLGFLTQLGGRSLGWALAGMTMGLGQGLVLRSHRLLLYGFLGGLIGGLVGGMLFDPIQKFLVPETSFSAHWARLAGLVVVGTFVGAMIGIVELLARDAWLNMVKGPLAGKEFLIFKDLVRVGASPASDIYLFNDIEVMQNHAKIRAVADNYEIEAVDHNIVLVNDRPVTKRKLRQGDQITLGQTIFVFQRRRSS